LNAIGKKTAKHSWAVKKILSEPTPDKKIGSDTYNRCVIHRKIKLSTITSIPSVKNPVSDLLAIKISVVDNLA
jgi:hypothetical protein